MDRRERADDLEEGLRAAMDGRQATIWTALPGEIVAYDAVAQTARVQPTIQGRVTAPTGEVSLVNMPLLLDCPVQFPAGGGASLTFPVVPGDECLVVFSSRCIDAWWQQGGVQPPMEHRMHDLSDGFVMLGFRSQPRRLSDVSTSAVALRSDDGTTKLELDQEARTIDLTAPGGATITADVTINGSLHVTGEITSDADVKVGAISLKHHKHGQVQAGGSQSGEPV
jgi:hypothetical protein